ncbi:MAG TPA: galactose oxidase-like domain-containing protein [Acidimicrobiales bacterium]|nr:galactose oxidase-like domain-containing protein [Acidimicrobiales bacterium]
MQFIGVRMRLRSLALALAFALVLGGAQATNVGAARVQDTGFLSIPFREDGAPFDPRTGTFGGARGDDGCLVDTPQAERSDCLPAAAAQVLLPDSRVLYWNAIEGGETVDGTVALQGGDTFINDQSRVLSLDYPRSRGGSWIASGTGAFPGTPGEPGLVPGVIEPGEGDGEPSDASLFCSDQKFLHDGRVLAVGGTNYYSEPRVADRVGVAELEGVRNTRIFDPRTNLWTKAPDMHYGRWYPSMITLANGDLFVASGVTKLIKPLYPSHIHDSGTNVRETETFTASTANPQFVDNGRPADRSLPLYPRFHLLPNGRVYYDAAGQAFNPAGQAYDEALWNEAAVYDPKARTWRGLGVPGLTTGGDPGLTEPGFRGSTFSQMLTLRPDREGRYSAARFLSAGGVLGGSPGSYLPTATARINHVEIGAAGQESLETYDAGRMNAARWYASGVVLPNGQVFVTSGGDLDGVVTPAAESPVRQTEIYTPDGTGGTWSLGPVLDRDRTYHNSAILLPTGQVLIGGHAPIPNGYGPVSNNPDTPVRDAVNNFKDASFQIYTPPNLARGYERPVINGNIRESLDYGSKLTIRIVRNTDHIHSVVLARNPSVTHLVDADQRMVELPVIDRQPGLITIRLPGPSILPRGPYMLFVNRDVAPGGEVDPNHLVPSVAKQVFVGAPAPAGIVNLPQTPRSPGRS